MGKIYDKSFQGLVDRWVREHTSENLSALQDAIQGHWSFTPALRVTPQVLPLLDELRFRSALQQLDAVMPGAMLSPSAHGLLARCHESLGNARAASREAWLMRASITAIVDSGTGTRPDPYVVLRHCDRHDFLEALGLRVQGEGVEHVDGQLLDRVQTVDGQFVHFRLRSALPTAAPTAPAPRRALEPALP